MRRPADTAELFRVHDVPAPDALFAELSASVTFEPAARGRGGAVLVATDDPRGIPIVRSTTRYERPAHPFRPVHTWLEQQIRACASLSRGFNNALIETYSNACTTMGAHSDLALDLDEDSEIALFSCYERPDPERPPRTLLVESKTLNGPRFAVPLPHHGVVLFSTKTNQKFRHRIVLDAAARAPENPWVAVTFRTSKTFVRFHEQQPHLSDGTPLRLASSQEHGEFLRLRGRENRETAFAYPPIAYTLSPSDRVPPE